MANYVTLKEYEALWQPEGSLYSLVFLTPERSVCGDDKRAYELLTARPGIAGASRITGSFDIPAAGHRRVSDRVWEAFITLTKNGVLGQILPNKLQPCGSFGAYELVSVNQLREGASALRNLLIDIVDVVEQPADTVQRTVVAASAGAVNAAEWTLETIVKALLPVAIPLTLGAIAYLYAKKHI